MTQEWETPCAKSEDGKHCDHWYDGDKCCLCNDAAEPWYGDGAAAAR